MTVCMQAADAITNPSCSRIDVISDTCLQTRIAQNKHILQQIVRAVLFLWRQGLAFCGDKEDINSSKNPGNFWHCISTIQRYMTYSVNICSIQRQKCYLYTY